MFVKPYPISNLSALVALLFDLFLESVYGPPGYLATLRKSCLVE
jgi:hypothetical protein